MPMCNHLKKCPLFSKVSMGALSQDYGTGMSIMAYIIIENAYLKPRHTYLHTFLCINVLLCDFLTPSAVSAAEWGETGRLGRL